MEFIHQTQLLKGAAGTAARVTFCPPSASRKWRLKSLTLSPNAALATDGTNYATLTFIKGAATTLATARTTNSSGGSAVAQGVVENVTLTAVGENLEITQADPMTVRLAHSGSGGAVDLSVQAEFEEIRP